VLELVRGADPCQLDDEPAGGRVSLVHPQLTGDEPDRDDPVLPGGIEQALPGLAAGRLGLELDLLEAGEGVADV
jgi:hypothetical protein